MVRRRSCFSCGEVQGGSAAFCHACGKPLDAPELEFLAVDSTAATGEDVVMATGGGRGRSVFAIVAVLAALGGVAAFSGKSGPTATPTPTTTAVSRVSSTTTNMTATTTTEASTSTTTDAAAARARELALTQPHTVATPILPEKTGTKLLLVGLGMVASGQRGNAILDLDSGLLTPYPDDGANPPMAQTYGSGLLLTAVSDAGVRFDTWQPTGPTGSVSVLIENFDNLFPWSALAGDVFWSVGHNRLESQNAMRLVGYDVRDGHKVSDVPLTDSSQLIGSDGANHPVVVDYGSGTYSFDLATQQFTRITSNFTLAVRGDWRVERTCTEQLVCGAVLLHGTDPPRPVPDLGTFNGPLSFSPNGQIVVQPSYRDGGPPWFEAVDLIGGARQKLDFEPNSAPSTLSWSSDSTWLFGLRSGVLSAWKVGTTKTLELAFDGDPVRVSAFGVFPTA